MSDGTVIIDTLLDTTGFENGVGKLKSLASKGAGLATKGIAAIGTALTGLGAYAVKVGSDFEEGMSKVQAISGATASDMEQLSAKAKEMGANTKFSATESAEAMQYMAMAGWKTQDMLDGISGIMNLAAASGENLGSVSDIVTDALTAFGMSASDSGHFADVLAQASSNANTNVAMLGESFKYVAPVCGSMGYNAEDASIALGLMANSGIKASQAGMTLKNAIVNMAKPTKKMQEVMDKYSLSLTNSDGSMKSLGEVMEMLRTNMGGLDKATQAAAAAQLFGKESMAGMLAVINASPADYEKLTNAIYNSDGAAQQMAETMNDNLKGQITLLKSALEGLGIQFYESVDNPMKDIVKSANNMVGQLSQAFTDGGFEGLTEELGTVLSEIVQGIASYTPTIINAAVTVIQSFIQGIRDNKESLAKSAVDIITSLVEGILTILPELLALGVEIITQISQGIAENLPELVPVAIDAILTIIDAIVDNIDMLADAAIKITIALAEGLIEALPKLIEKAPEIISKLVEALVNNSAAILEAGVELDMKLAEALIESAPLMILAVPELIKNITKGIMEGDFSGIKESFGSKMGEVFEEPFNKGFELGKWMKTADLDDFLNATKENFSLLGSAIDLGGWIAEQLKSAGSSIAEWANSTSEYFSNMASEAGQSLQNGFNSFLEWLNNKVQYVTETLPAQISQMASQLGEHLTEGFNSFTEWLSNLPYMAGEVVGTTASAIINGFNDAVEWFNELPGVISEAFNQAVQSVEQWGSDTYNSASNWVTETVNGIGDWFNQASDSISTALNNAITSVETWGSNTYNSAVTWVQQTVTGIGQFFSQLPSTIAGALSNALQAVVEWGSNLVSQGKQSANECGNSIVQGFSAIPGKMAEIGRNIVAGIKNGISAAWSGMTGWIGGLCDSFISGVKAKLDIHSPSKRMAREIGVFIPAGIKVGIEQGTPELLNSAKDVCDQLTDTFANGLNADVAQSYIDNIKGVSGKFSDLYNDLSAAQENVNWANGLTLDDNKWYYDAKTRLEDVKSQLEDLSEQISDTEDKSAKESLQKQQKELQKQQKLIQKEYDYYKEAAQEEINQRKEATKKQLEIEKEKQQKLVNLAKATTEAIKNQLTEQKNNAISAIEDELNALEAKYNKEADRIDANSEKKKARIQSEIDALEDEEEAENRLKEVQEANNNIAVLQAKMNNTASEADKKAYALKIKNAKAALAEKQKEWDRTDEKAALQAEQDELEERSNKKKDRLKEEYEAKKESLEKEKKATEEYYQTLLETDNINAQARYMLLRSSNEQLVELLQSYNPEWQNAGQSLADSLINGLNSQAESMQSAIDNILSGRGYEVQQIKEFRGKGYASGTSSNRLAGLYNVDEKGFELSTNNNPVAYVSKGAGILNHMQSLKAIKDEVSSQVASQMSAIKNMIIGQQQQMYALAGAMAGSTTNNSSVREGDVIFHVDNFHNDNKDSIENIANELGFHARKNKRC